MYRIRPEEKSRLRTLTKEAVTRLKALGAQLVSISRGRYDLGGSKIPTVRLLLKSPNGGLITVSRKGGEPRVLFDGDGSLGLGLRYSGVAYSGPLLAEAIRLAEFWATEEGVHP